MTGQHVVDSVVALTAVWAQADPVTIVSVLASAVAVLVGALVTARSARAKSEVDRLTLNLTNTDNSVAHFEAALERADKEREATEARHGREIERLHARLDASDEARRTDNERCDVKLRRLGHIVKELGGKVPDDLNGLD